VAAFSAWLATMLAVALVVTPTYGLGLMVAPVDAVVVGVVLRSDDSRSLAHRAGAAANLAFLVLALAVLSAAWGWTWPLRNTWGCPCPRPQRDPAHDASSASRQPSRDVWRNSSLLRPPSLTRWPTSSLTVDPAAAGPRWVYDH
jgi:hypothetical protein